MPSARFVYFCLAAALQIIAASPTLAGQFAQPLSVSDDLATTDSITVSTADWKIVFERKFNGGPSKIYDLAFDPTETDNLVTASGGGFYSNGGFFDYDIYLGTNGANQQEYMTTMGTNSSFGSLQLSILENTPARVRIQQSGSPRLNNGTGPPGNPFPELPLISFTTIWTIYPTGKVNIDFVSTVETSGMTVDSGPGGGGAGIDASGTTVTAVNGTNFQSSGVWAGDTIESSDGGWGPIAITARTTATQLQLASTVPSGTSLSFVVKRSNIVNETISIHGDGDPNLVNQCVDPAVSHWQGGSDGDPLWSSGGDGCGSVFHGGQPWLDSVLAHWTRSRGYGSLLAFFEPWSTANYGAYNDVGFTDISYTQLGRFGVRAATGHDRHFLAQMGSSATVNLPTIKSAADAQPYADDYLTPYAQALVGSLATGAEIAAPGFNKAGGTYDLNALSCGASCSEAEILFDAGAGGRSAAAYLAPAIRISGLAASAELSARISTDAGATYSTLAPTLYNLTGAAEESETGTGTRVFQYLGEIPATATASSAVAFRFETAAEHCPATPDTGCLAAGKSFLKIKNRADSDKDQLLWKWLRGPATTIADWGLPLSDTDFAVCIYTGTGANQVYSAGVAGGGVCNGKPCWKTLGSSGYRFKDRDGLQDGHTKIVAKSGTTGTTNRSKAIVKTKGGSIVLPSLPLDISADIVVQLHRSDDPICFESRFAPTSLTQNDADGVKARQ